MLPPRPSSSSSLSHPPAAARALEKSGAKLGIVGAGVQGSCNPVEGNYQTLFAVAGNGTWLGVLPGEEERWGCGVLHAWWPRCNGGQASSGPDSRSTHLSFPLAPSYLPQARATPSSSTAAARSTLPRTRSAGAAPTAARRWRG